MPFWEHLCEIISNRPLLQEEIKYIDVSFKNILFTMNNNKYSKIYTIHKIFQLLIDGFLIEQSETSCVMLVEDIIGALV